MSEVSAPIARAGDGQPDVIAAPVGRAGDEPVISTRRVNYDFGVGESRSRVLFEVDLDIGQGEVVIMTGPSGSGKTTLLTLIGALRHVQEGSLRVLGRELAGMAAAEQVRHRRHIGFIFQHHNLFSSLTALENVRMATALESAGVAERDGRAAEILGRLGLADRLDHRPGRLSGGQRQRVAIARALVNVPALVLADEPTAALDAESGAIVMGMLHELANAPARSTVLIVTHDQRLIDRADRIINMVGGRVVSNVRPKLVIRICEVLSMMKELDGLGASTLTRIAERMTVEFRRKGETIVREGETGERTYVIAQGLAEATRGNAAPREIHVGQRFGRITAIAQEPNPETVRAKTDLELFTISRGDFMYILATDKSLEERVRLYYMNRQS
ncbi:MAG TPA: ATP-binding cassette domain-containing protein [Isosphaeraceae bacterium]|nr:ATP-binding cassette domain-containing protein [Isosphaeraceae bacterium]